MIFNWITSSLSRFLCYLYCFWKTICIFSDFLMKHILCVEQYNNQTVTLTNLLVVYNNINCKVNKKIHLAVHLKKVEAMSNALTQIYRWVKSALMEIMLYSDEQNKIISEKVYQVNTASFIQINLLSELNRYPENVFNNFMRGWWMKYVLFRVKCFYPI